MAYVFLLQFRINFLLIKNVKIYKQSKMNHFLVSKFYIYFLFNFLTLIWDLENHYDIKC